MEQLKEYPQNEITSERPYQFLLLEAPDKTPDEKRKVTDKWFLLVFGALVVISLPFIIYTLCNSDINRLKEYDDCGNICGQNNPFDPKIPCSGVDYTNKPYYYNAGCNAKSPSYSRIYNYPPLQLSIFIGRIVISSAVPLGLSLLLTVGFRYVPFFTVVAILALSWGCFLAATFGSYYLGLTYYITSGVLGCIMVATIILCTTISAANRIRMAMMVFKESSNAISHIKRAVPVSFMILLLLLPLVVVAGLTHIQMSTAGILGNTKDNRIGYVQNGPMTTAIVLNIVLTLLTVQIILRFQDMAVSSAASKWYSFRGTVTTNFYTTLKNHLGTVILGSIVFNLLAIPRIFLAFLSQTCIKRLADYLLRYLNGFHYSYIFTASQGTSFQKSSEKVRQLLNLKIAETPDLISMGNLMMLLSQILVGLVSMVFNLIAFEGARSYHEEVFSSCILAIISVVCCCTLLGPVWATYDTLCMCACEDILKEGDKQYSVTIEEFNKNYAEVLEKKIKGIRQPTTSDAAL